MKKIIYLIFIFTLGVLVFSSCKPAAPETFTVKFLSDSQTPIYNEVVEIGNKVVSWPEDQTKNNLVFAGWFDGDNLYDSNFIVTKNIILEAKWYAIITIVDQEGVVVDEKQVLAGTSIVNLPALDKDGFTYHFESEDGTLVDFSSPVLIEESVTYIVVYTQI
jgi:hypothetical protein